MSFQYVINSIEANGLSAAQKITLIALANRANDAGVCYPSQATIAKDTALSVRHVYRCLCDLQELGILSWTAQHDTQDRRKKKNIYKLDVKKIAGLSVKGDSMAEETNNIDSLHGHEVTQNQQGFATAKNLTELAG